MSHSVTLDRLREAVAVRGVAPVARELGVPRSAVTAVLAGVARDGTRELVERRAAERLRVAA